MGLHNLEFVIGKTPRFVQYLIGNLCFSHIVQQPGKLSGFLQPKRQQPLAGVACNGFIMGPDGLHRLLMILHPNMGRKDTIHGTPPLLQ